MSNKSVKVTLREKKISKGRKSLYLDFYPEISLPDGKKTRREFLGLYIFERAKDPFEKQHNKETKALARSILNQRYFEIQNDSYGYDRDAKKQESFLDYFDRLVKARYSSKGNYDNWLSASNYLHDYFSSGLTMGDITQRILEDFREYLVSLDLAQNTKRSYFNKLKAAVKKAFKDGYLNEDVASRVEAIAEEETVREYLLENELKPLIATECDIPILKNAFLFSCFTGLRFSDIAKLTWQEIQGDEEQGYLIRFRQKKTKGAETMPVPKIAMKWTGEPGQPTDKVFNGLKYSSWNNQKIREWVNRSGINKDITFHCARHTYATLQLSLGTDIYTVSKLLGHKDLKTTAIYTKIVDSLKTDAANRLDQLNLDNHE